MNKKSHIITGLMLCALALCGCMFFPSKSKDDKLNIEPPKFKTAPLVKPIDEVPDVYYAQGTMNIFKYKETWFYYCGDVWFASKSYNGPWTEVETYSLPGRFGEIPSKYLRSLEEQKERNK